MVSEKAGDEHDIARSRRPDTKFNLFSKDADSARRDEQTVAGAFLHNFRVSGYNLDARASRSLRHGGRNTPQQFKRHALFNDHGAGQEQRPRAADGEIVDRPTYGELSDIAARESQRRHNEGIGREGQTIATGSKNFEIEARLVFHFTERRIVERFDEDVVYQILHGLSAAAMRERNLRDEDLPQGARSGERAYSHDAFACRSA